MPKRSLGEGLVNKNLGAQGKFVYRNNKLTKSKTLVKIVLEKIELLCMLMDHNQNDVGGEVRFSLV